jgi:2'-5' RNA ligase
VAVRLPDDLREKLRAWVADVRRGGALDADWRWTEPDGWHITLAFLGATAPDAVAGIVEHLSRDLEGRHGFTVTAGDFGAFPGRSRARVLWYGIQDADRRLAELADVVRASSGTDEASPFRPHVTLARARDRQGSLAPRVPQGPPAREMAVSSVLLMRSDLGSGPPHCETLAEIALLTPAAAGAPA